MPPFWLAIGEAWSSQISVKLLRRHCPRYGVIEADRWMLLTSLRKKSCIRWNGRSVGGFSHSTVTRRHRHTIDVSLCVAREAEAIHLLVPLIIICRAYLRRCCGLWTGRHPSVHFLRDLRHQGEQ